MISSIIIDRIIETALEEDLTQAGDITSQALFDGSEQAEASIIIKQAGILCGIDIAERTFLKVDPSLTIEIIKYDGQKVDECDIAAKIKGSSRSILTAERTALNFVMHLSGIASQTAFYIDKIKQTNAKLCDTRKTTPGLRGLEKYAVSCGGGSNHRFGLYDAILIKDNHIAASGGIKQALDRVQRQVGHTVKIEIEVDTLEQLAQVIDHGGADIVMLDNFDVKDLEKAIAMINSRITSEASGGINLETIEKIAKTGVNYISVGAITHSAPALDIGLDLKNTK